MTPSIDGEDSVRSVAGFLECVEKVVKEWTPRDADWYLQPWFRGHGDASWSLEPGWYRVPHTSAGLGSEYYSEATLLGQFKRRAPTFLPRIPDNDWEWLFLMQHHGLRTRLLDWTESALVALYFAIRANAGKSDAAVWAMSPWWLNRKTFKKYVLPSADDPMTKDHAPLDSRKRPKGRLPIAILPVHASPRIVAQRGVFTIHGSLQGALDKMAKKKGRERSCLRRMVIPRASVDSVRQELAVAGVSETLIFPELDGLCRELKMDFFGE